MLRILSKENYMIILSLVLLIILSISFYFLPNIGINNIEEVTLKHFLNSFISQVVV